MIMHFECPGYGDIVFVSYDYKLINQVGQFTKNRLICNRYWREEPSENGDEPFICKHKSSGKCPLFEAAPDIVCENNII